MSDSASVLVQEGDNAATAAASTGGGRRRGSVRGLAGAIYVSTLLGIVTAPIVARALGAEGRGAYAAINTYALLATSLLAFGLAPAVMWAIRTERLDVAGVLGSCLRFCIYVTPAAIALGLGVAMFVLAGDDDTTRSAAFAFVALAPLSVFQLCLVSVMTAAGALGNLAVIRLAPFLIGAAGVLVLAVVGALTLESYLAVTLVGIFATLWISVRAVRVKPGFGMSLRPLLRFGSRAYVGSLASLGNAQLDQALIAPFLGLKDLGHYAVAVTIASVPIGLIQAIAVRAVSEMTDEEGALTIDAVAARMRLAVLVGAIGSAGLAVIVPFAVPFFFGSDFGPTTALCLVLLIGTIALAVTAVANPALVLAGRPRDASAAEVVALVITGVGLAIALPLIGVMGAAIVSVVAYWSRAVLQVAMLRRLGIHDLFPRSADVSALIAQLPGRSRVRRSSP